MPDAFDPNGPFLGYVGLHARQGLQVVLNGWQQQDEGLIPTLGQDALNLFSTSE